MKRALLFLTGVLLLAFCLQGISVQGQDAGNGKSAYYRELGKEYKSQVRKVLEEAGIRNAGLTMTYVRHADGTRDYRLQIHHEKLSELPAQDLLDLQHRLSSLKLPVPDCSVKQEFSA